MNTINFNVLAKPIGPICNLACTYCFYLEKQVLYPKASTWKMSERVLDEFIRQYIELHDTPLVNFSWQGGEPTLLEVDYFKRIVAIQKKYANGKQIRNAFQTNGILLNEVWADFLKENNFLVGISIDGPRKLHDTYRVNKSGQATFGQVMHGLEILKQNHIEFNTLTTVNQENVESPLQVYNFLKKHGSQYMQFIPIVERIANRDSEDKLQLVSPQFAQEAYIAPWSVDPIKFGHFLCTIFDEWVRKDVGQYFVQLFDVSLEMWAGLESSLCVFRRQCGDAIVMEHNGDIYSCDHFVYPQNELGNLMEVPLKVLGNSKQQNIFGKSKDLTLPNYCRKCDVRFACNGECPKHRFLITPEGEPGLNYFCAGYRKFFHHIDPYMRFMVRELRENRAPANVMKWLNSQKR